MVARKIGPLQMIENFNPNAYRFKLPSHIKASNVSSAKHLVLYIGDSLDDDANSRANSLQPEEDDVDQIANNFMKKFERENLVRTQATPIRTTL
jgi:predicted secreted acid phosphatase